MYKQGPLAQAAESDHPAGGRLVPDPLLYTTTGAAVLDELALQRLRDLDPHNEAGLLKKVVQAFNSSTNRLLPQMVQAASCGDLAGVRHVAHTLKSSSASLGALQLSGFCGELEHQIRCVEVIDLDLQVSQIAAEIALVLQALRNMTGAIE